eukprot:sb/3476948/
MNGTIPTERDVRRTKIGASASSVTSGLSQRTEKVWRRNLNRIKNISFDKSFADYLNTERGIVRGRVASLLRTSEIKPYVLLICTYLSYYRFFIRVLKLQFDGLLSSWETHES